MDWEDIAIAELYQRFDSIYRSVDKVVFPGLCNSAREKIELRPTLSHGVACLTGRKDRFDSPIIYVPNSEKLPTTSENDFKCIIKYLVAATNASSADVGFVVLIDSRQSRWSSLAWLLRNVASCFPGELKMILALKPTNFLHGTLSTIAMRYQKDEYNFKVPIELIACIDSAWPWIAKSDLPQELGGEAQYDHSAWIQKRHIIEKLATVLKQVIQRCKSYSTALINDQIFPDENAEQKVLGQNQECERVMGDVKSLEKDAKIILQDEMWQNDPCGKEAVSTSLTDIQHLSSLVLEVKDTFHTFWKTYEAKRDGYLQLRSFEKNYKRAASRISCLIENLEYETGRAESSGSREINISCSSSNDKLTEICLKASVDGEVLMRDHPYAIDCIKPKCEELKRLSECYQTLMDEKIQNDNLFNQTKEAMQKVNEWCSSGMKLLSVQNLDRAKSADGLQEALAELESFTSTTDLLNVVELQRQYDEKNHAIAQIEKPLQECLIQFDLINELFTKRMAILKLHAQTESLRDDSHSLEKPLEKQEAAVTFQSSPPKQENTAIVHPIPQNVQSPTGAASEKQYKLRQVINELLETERKYVEELGEIVHGYGLAIDDPSLKEFLPQNLKENRRLLLGNLEEIMLFHQKCFLPKMMECEYDEIAIGNLFIDKISDFSLYYEFCHDSNKIKSFRKQIGESHVFFVECQRRLGHRLPLSAYLLKPVQRITKYHLLLQQMQKYGEETESDALAKAVNAMMDVLKELNDSMHEIAITGFQDDISALGRLLMQGSFQIQIEPKRGKVKDFARSKFNKAVPRHLFLYRNGLLMCKKSQSSDQIEGSDDKARAGSKLKGDGEAENSYQFKRYVKIKEITLTENIKGCPRKFKLYCRDDDTELTIITASNAVKQDWIKALQNCVNRYKETTAARSYSPSKAGMHKSPLKAPLTKKAQDAQTKTQPCNEVRQSKIQRTKSLGKNSTKPRAKSVLDRQKSLPSGDKISPKKISKRTKSRSDGKKEKSGGEVTFQNIHGVDKSPTKAKVRHSSGESKTTRILPVDESKTRPLRGKKTKS